MTLPSEVLEKARLAVDQMQERAGGRLDYSERSLEAVEELLEEASQYEAELDAGMKRALVELLGCYILAVANRAHGGEFMWLEERAQPVLVVGEPAFHVAMIAFDKVRGRLGGDKGDNIPFFYEGFAGRVKAAGPGTKALYV